MRMNEGVEWALHSCLNLSWATPGEAVTAGKLAAFYDLPAAYLNKQLQALARAGILTSTSGPRGGFRLARSPEEITLLDVVTAIEGPEDAFKCEQILAQGPGGRPDVDYRAHCVISQSMRSAELAWRRELAGRTLADLKATVERRFPHVPETTRNGFANVRP
ncbi:Rrf2 family transcriptional regulator [Nonomuraea sp. NN258]|uniref:RrF2 family transcriptional regulator n=1 Tax=Nonomuraea antri TaxID=2730852 RepID=UPI00156911A4|nr:Rrf2 family transcriptional regulator [Nonomuraea antri]NRQ35508.1 Rrf2 family transcriptional regulator [Nonomuraea antri]